MELSSYEMLDEIGRGSFSHVYKVRKIQTGEFFAMKKIDYEHLNEQQKLYAKDEISILKKIQHPNIISFEGSFFENGFLYIIIELAHNGDLQQKLNDLIEAKSHLKLDLIWRYTYQIVLGLQALHNNGIVHRDMKAANIFLCNNNIVKIGDFNVGKENVRSLIKTRIGTPLTMSPEVLQGKEYSYKTDIWSLGCIVYEMATLKKPYEAEHEFALIRKVEKMVIEIPSDRKLEKFTKKLMKYKPNNRPTCDEILKMDEFKLYRLPENGLILKTRREKKINTCGRVSSLANLSINRDLRKNLYESPSNPKLRNRSLKGNRTPSYDRYISKSKNNDFEKRFPTSDKKSVNNSKFHKDISLRILDLNDNIVYLPKNNSESVAQNELGSNGIARLFNKFPISFGHRINGGFNQSEKKIQFKFTNFDKSKALNAPRSKQPAGLGMNDVYVVKHRTSTYKSNHLGLLQNSVTPKSQNKVTLFSKLQPQLSSK